MTGRKFNVKDKVTINERCPLFLSQHLRKNRPRTITHRFYDDIRECSYLYLGINQQGQASFHMESYPFRSYMLDKVVIGRHVGRPREKRRYRKHQRTPAKVT